MDVQAEEFMKKVQWKSLFLSILVSLGAGAIGGWLSRGSMIQYQSLPKPFLAPPGWIFPIVWTVLYLLMGISAYLVYAAEDEDRRLALTLYGIQMAVNVLWPFFFFKLNAILFSFVWTLLLLDFVILMAKCFSNVNERAGKLVFPYLLWVIYAVYLNGAYVIFDFIGKIS